MMDTLQAGADATAGVPDAGTRIIYLVAILFVLSILGVLIWARMRESDEALKP
jgi:hypothetical protein